MNEEHHRLPRPASLRSKDVRIAAVLVDLMSLTPWCRGHAAELQFIGLLLMLVSEHLPDPLEPRGGRGRGGGPSPAQSDFEGSESQRFQ